MKRISRSRAGEAIGVISQGAGIWCGGAISTECYATYTGSTLSRQRIVYNKCATAM